MKKLLIGLALVGIIALPLVTQAVARAPVWIKSCTVQNDQTSTIDPLCTKGTRVELATDSIEGPEPGSGQGNAFCCIFDSLFTITNTIFWAILVAAIFFILRGAYEILTAAGDSKKVTKGRDFILYASVGFLAAMLAKAFPQIVRWIFGI